MARDSITVRHAQGENRFVADVVGGEAELVYTGPKAGVVSFVHTEVPPQSRGAGVAESLARAALSWARQSRLWVRPVCPYVAAFMRRHHGEYGDLLERDG